MPRWRPLISVAAAGAALMTLLPGRWQTVNADAVREAVLKDLLEDRRGPRGQPEFVVCAELWSGPHWRVPPGASEDPSATVLKALRSSGRAPIPQSACDVREEGVTERANGAKGVLIGAAVLRPIGEDFVRVEAGWYYFGLGAEARQYTLSRVGGRWVVDTQRLLWIS